MKLSLVVPCFNEQGNIIPFTQAVRSVFPEGDYELIFVNDGSTDDTLREIGIVTGERKENIKAISFSRNFGKEAAMYAGLKESAGDYVAIIDADLQQNPVFVRQMAEILDSDPAVDAVCAVQSRRKENPVVSLLKKGFYSFSDSISEVRLEENASDFRTMRRKVVDAILSIEEYTRFSKGIFSFVGFRTVYIPYTVEKRYQGRSKWSVRSLFDYAFTGILSFSVKPLKIPMILGILCIAVSVILAIVFSLTGVPAAIRAIICLMFLIGGMIMVSLGIMCEYLALTYKQSKNRPVYIIKEITTSEKSEE